MNVPYVVLIMQGRRQAPNGLFLKRRVFRRALTLCLAAGIWLAVAVPAQAAGDALDAHQLVFGTTASSSVTANNRSMLAQTFKAVAGGQLDRVSLVLSTPTGPVSLYVEIHNASGGQPSGPALATAPLPSNPGLISCCSWNDFSFNPGIHVTAGFEYAIVISLRFDSITWYDDYHGNTYADGQPFKFAGGAWAPMTNDFAFKTYVAVASAPMLTVDSANVAVTEGIAPTNSGTVSDPNGAAIMLSVASQTGSAGTITPNAAAGTWSWTGVAADEGPGQTIVVTADDGLFKTTKSFTTTVGSTPPIAKINGAPANAVEGTTITLTGTASSPSAEDNAAPFTYSWSATENGNALGAGPTSGPTYPIKVDDESTYKVTLTATDDGGFSGKSEVTINGVDSKPSVAVSVSQPFVIVPQEPLAFTGTFTDTGSTVDTSYKATWTWGDGLSTNVDPANPKATHPYAASGTYTATLTVTDDDGVAGSASTIVTVVTPEAAMSRIAGYVQTRPGLNAGQKNSLLAKLNAATDSMQRGNTGAACNQLTAFGNEADAQQKAGHLTSGEANTMIDAARVTQRAMGCFRTLVDFLSGL